MREVMANGNGLTEVENTDAHIRQMAVNHAQSREGKSVEGSDIEFLPKGYVENRVKGLIEHYEDPEKTLHPDDKRVPSPAVTGVTKPKCETAFRVIEHGCEG